MWGLMQPITLPDVVLRSHKCNSVWCPKCYRYRKLPALYDRINGRMDWRSTRFITLTVDPSLFDSAQDAWEYLTKNKKIAQLIHNLKRTQGISVRDYVWILEFHRNGFPHWHILVDTEKTGKNGMIHFSNLKKYWKWGHVDEKYFKTKKDWHRLVGYFGKHGYFHEKKAHQARLPQWGKEYRGTIKRTSSGRIQSAWKPSHVLAQEEERKRMREITKKHIQSEEENLMKRNGCSDETPQEEGRKEYKTIIDSCGSMTHAVIMQNDLPFMGFSIRIPISKMKIQFPTGEFCRGVGYVVPMDNRQVLSFINKYSPKL
jgi:hypothetical protein